MTMTRNREAVFGLRRTARLSQLHDLRLSYEGRSEFVTVHPPDLSPMGMFINTPENFPEGAVLKLQFRLARSGYEVQTRAEVRFCMPGVGIGIEFIDLLEEHFRAIEEEIDITAAPRNRDD
jgi:PilZ domain-containing protein